MKYLQTVKEFAQLKPGQLIYRWDGSLIIYRVSDVIKYDDFVTVQLANEENNDVKHLSITAESVADHSFYYDKRATVMNEIKDSIIFLNNVISKKLKELAKTEENILHGENLLNRI